MMPPPFVSRVLWLLCAAGVARAAYFAHVTDVHLQSTRPYDPRAHSRCVTDPLGLPCCYAHEWGVASSAPCGQHGNWNADAPFSLFNASLAFLAESFGEELDFVLFTGDCPDHLLPLQTYHSIQASVTNVTLTFRQHFPRHVFPSLGNHDGCPLVDQFPDKPLDASCVDYVRDLWYPWFTPYAPSWNQTMDAFSAYLVPHPTLDNTFIMSLNTLLDDAHDVLPDRDIRDRQRAWAEFRLDDIASKNGTVWLQGHVFGGAAENRPDYTDWLRNVSALYNGTIRYYFFGHTHRDELRVFRGRTGVMWMPGSVTPFPNHNPCVRVYEYDDHKGDIRDYVEFCTALDTIHFKERYRATAAFGISDVAPGTMYDLVASMRANRTTFDVYYNISLTEGPYVPCDDACWHDTVNKLFV